ncbi:MAG: low specificity L-threonine aldolase [Sphaerochaetaceae bacterium]
MNIYDLRSDTITKPTALMRQAMANAEVGDDVYSEDPTVNLLEGLAAQLTGKESALLVTSGSMGNLIPLYINGGRGTEVLAHTSSHIIQHEVGAAAAIAGILPIGVESPRGLLNAQVLEPHIKPIAYDLARTAMIEVENTIGGVCYPLETLLEIKDLADRHHLKIHMDGARLWNASIATGHPVHEIAAVADTVTFCLSKGLGAPVGSLLCGSRPFIAQARSVRKMLGGGMRQAGILAAAGIYALEHHVARLAEDHADARKIAEALSHTGWAQLTLGDVETNIIFFSVPGYSGQQVVSLFASKGILCTCENDCIRLVTNLDLSGHDTDEVCRIIDRIDITEAQQ